VLLFTNQCLIVADPLDRDILGKKGIKTKTALAKIALTRRFRPMGVRACVCLFHQTSAGTEGPRGDLRFAVGNPSRPGRETIARPDSHTD
jgi:hypothetical protein